MKEMTEYDKERYLNWAVNKAAKNWEGRDLMIDRDPIVRHPDGQGGAWVKAWVWIDHDKETPWRFGDEE